MFKMIIRSSIATMLLALILCGGYPLLITGIGRLLFHDKANGGLIVLEGGRVVGARLIGQAFTKPEYFHGRPSAAGYDATNSTGSNLGPTNQKFVDTLKANVDAVLKENPDLKKGEIPTDLVTASGSGLDPHISPEAARAQLGRVAKARGVAIGDLEKLVSESIERPQLGILGEPVVNVLLVNLQLDRLYPMNRKYE